jgi:hypothetical protein
MAQQLQSVSIAAPGFFGMNTQDSPVESPPRFASIALNCVIDQYGRVGARKGYSYITTNAAAISGGNGLTTIYEYIKKSDGTKVVFSTGNNKLLTGTVTLVDATPASYTITAEDWKIVELNEKVYFFQRGYEPCVYSESTGTIQKMSAVSGGAGTPPQANEALGAFGRLFVADFTTDKHTIYWSDLLQGHKWTGGSSGSLDINKVWPRGADEIVALAQHNNFLVIMGRRSTIIYGGMNDPSTMAVTDIIDNVGCIARDSVQNTGADILFLSEHGVQSLGRLIQEKSAILKDISRNVRNDITNYITLETGIIKSVYSTVEAFYLVTFPYSGITYCFDMRGMLEDGSARTTIWNKIEPQCFHVNKAGNLYMGHANGITLFDEYNDNLSTYSMEYFSNPMSFGNATTLKFVKKIAMTIIGGAGAITNLQWAYDYLYNYRSSAYTLSSGSIAEYNTAEFNVGEYSTGVVITRPSINASGSGFVATIGITSEIDGAALSIQQIDVLALMGRLV